MRKNQAARRASSEPARPLGASLPSIAKPRIGLALGGGGARGIAHILAFEVFEELGVRPHMIAGSSIGAIFGAAYASGLSAAQLRSHTEDTLTNRFDLIRQLFTNHPKPVRQLLNIFPWRSAVLNPATILEIVLPPTIPQTFEELEIPLQIVATNLGKRDTELFKSGPLKPAVAASMAIPVVFAPVSIEGHTLADGGLTNPLPYNLLEPHCDITVAIDVSGAASEAVIGPKPSVTTVLTQSVQILQKRIIREQLARTQPDIYIDVDLDRFSAYQFHKVKDILAAAEQAKQQLKTKLIRILQAVPADQT